MLFAVGSLPDDPLAAAAQFHGDVLPRLLASLAQADGLATLVFAPAGHAHVDWRRAAVATLARERAPLRINAVAGDDATGIAATGAYIASAPGLTGQYLVVDGQGAGSAAPVPA